MLLSVPSLLSVPATPPATPLPPVPPAGGAAFSALLASQLPIAAGDAGQAAAGSGKDLPDTADVAADAGDEAVDAALILPLPLPLPMPMVSNMPTRIDGEDETGAAPVALPAPTAGTLPQMTMPEPVEIDAPGQATLSKAPRDAGLTAPTAALAPLPIILTAPVLVEQPAPVPADRVAPPLRPVAITVTPPEAKAPDKVAEPTITLSLDRTGGTAPLPPNAVVPARVALIELPARFRAPAPVVTEEDEDAVASASRPPSDPGAKSADTVAPLVAAPRAGSEAQGQARDHGGSFHREAAWAERMERIEVAREAADATDRRIRLTPDALGPVDVRVRREGEGVQIQLSAEQATTRTLLAEAAPRLAEWTGGRGMHFAGGGTGESANQRFAHPAQPAAPHRQEADAAPDPTDHRLA